MVLVLPDCFCLALLPYVFNGFVFYLYFIGGCFCLVYALALVIPLTVAFGFGVNACCFISGVAGVALAIVLLFDFLVIICRLYLILVVCFRM